jgi:hypothetical protein
MGTDLESGGAYDIAPTARPERRLPAAPAPATIPLSYQTAPKTAPQADPQTITNLYAPLWLLGGGVAVQVVMAFLMQRDLAAALMYVAVVLFAGTATMLVGVLLAARWRQIDLGSFGPAVLKLAAISVAPGAAVAIMSLALRFIPVLGALAGLIIEFVLYFAMLGALFDLEDSDTWYCVCVIFLVRLAIYFGVLFVL